jgi:hypothetical protein
MGLSVSVHSLLAWSCASTRSSLLPASPQPPTPCLLPRSFMHDVQVFRLALHPEVQRESRAAMAAIGEVPDEDGLGFMRAIRGTYVLDVAALHPAPVRASTLSPLVWPAPSCPPPFHQVPRGPGQRNAAHVLPGHTWAQASEERRHGARGSHRWPRSPPTAWHDGSCGPHLRTLRPSPVPGTRPVRAHGRRWLGHFVQAWSLQPMPASSLPPPPLLHPLPLTSPPAGSIPPGGCTKMSRA